MSFSLAQLAPALISFRNSFPKIKLELDFTDRHVNLVDERVDVALRITRDPGSSLVSRKLASLPVATCAAPAYVQAFGSPQEPGELAQHKTLCYSYVCPGDVWSFDDPAGNPANVRLHPEVRANNGEILRDLAIAGGGIVQQPLFILAKALANGELIPVLDGWRSADYGFYALYLSRQNLPHKIRVFVNHLVAHFPPLMD